MDTNFSKNVNLVSMEGQNKMERVCLIGMYTE